MFTIGCDPEIFFLNPRTRRAVSAIGHVGGTKHHPIPLWEHGQIQEDNVTAEFTIDPVSNLDDFRGYVMTSVLRVREIAWSLNYDIGMDCAYLYSQTMLNKYGPKAIEIGCDPDFFVGALNPRPVALRDGWRYAGGHVHLGIAEECTTEASIELALRMSNCLGNGWHVDKHKYAKRAEAYPMNIFRPKKYGAEFRGLPNTWVFYERAIDWVYRVAKSVYDNQHRTHGNGVTYSNSFTNGMLGLSYLGELR
jgi:hypothetical protein